MATSNTNPQERTAGGSTTRHSKDDALADREFELFLEGCERLGGADALQARFVALVGGRLGLRVGELTHIKESWVDWRNRVIEIPHYDRCHKGRDGGLCGYCEQAAVQMVEYNDDVTLDAARAEMWRPKTSAAARKVPFDFDARVELIVERFFDRYGEWPLSRTAVTRRVNKAADAADELSPEHVYPHALRATAATHHAGRGLDVLPLQSLMGWAQAATAQVYVKRSVENTRRALHMVHSR